MERMQNKLFVFSGEKTSLDSLSEFVFRRRDFSGVMISTDSFKRIDASHARLQTLLEKGLPIYGVTTGFGDSVQRSVGQENSEELQANLVSYLLCGSGPSLPVEASRAMFAIRLKSLSRGYSGVSRELMDRMRLYLERDWIPVCPREGSLGASGDLIPLAYLAQILQGEGRVHIGDQLRLMKDVLKENSLAPYRLKAKEGLALVNGTSTMAGLCLYNLRSARFLSDLTCLMTGWLCLALKGRTEAFGELVNDKAKFHPGQSAAALMVRKILQAENYSSTPLDKIEISDRKTTELIQDRYSLRCTPQIMGPIYETLTLVEGWLENEVNSTSDNPLIGEDGRLEMGGNFYGGHLSHGMDYLKICLGHTADLVDRQLMTLIDEKSNRGLPANLINTEALPVEKRFLHHGLKGLHQAVSALTSETMARTMPNGVFSRSSESHNQDKVSLGMSAAVQCSQMMDPIFTIMSMYLVCLTQALDLRHIQLQGADSIRMYKMIRAQVPLVSKDQPLGDEIARIAENLKQMAREVGGVFQ
jgi:histidine ammonia-lyase